MKTSFGICETLGIAFIILKLCNAINWDWWVVCIPFYPVVFFHLLALVCAGLLILAKWIEVMNRD